MKYSIVLVEGREEGVFLEEVNTCLREEIYDPLGAKRKETV